MCGFSEREHGRSASWESEGEMRSGAGQSPLSVSGLWEVQSPLERAGALREDRSVPASGSLWAERAEL